MHAAVRIAAIAFIALTAPVLALAAAVWMEEPPAVFQGRASDSTTAAARAALVQLNSNLIDAVGAADSAARAKARAELRAWTTGVARRADGPFLDWHFSYFSGRLRDIHWTWDRLWSGKQQADDQYLAEIGTKFAELVLSQSEAEAGLKHVIDLAAQEFETHLNTKLLTLRQQSSLDPAQFDAMLRRVSILAFDDNGRREPVNLLAIAEGSRRLMRLVSRVAEGVRPQGLEPVRQASALLGAAPVAPTMKATAGLTVAKKAAAAKAMAIGGAIACVVVVTVAVGYEWYAHTEYVNQHRPKLGEAIALALDEFAENALADTGHVGIGLHAVRTDLIKSVQAQQSFWGRMRARAEGYLSVFHQ